jgi:hypothetical protein
MIAFACREPLEKECRISILKLAIWKVFSFFLVPIHDVECLWSGLMQRAGLQTSGNQKWTKSETGRKAKQDFQRP